MTKVELRCIGCGHMERYNDRIKAIKRQARTTHSCKACGEVRFARSNQQEQSVENNLLENNESDKYHNQKGV